MTTPRFYQELISLFSTQEETRNQQNMIDRNHRFSIRQISPDWNLMATKEAVIVTPGNALRIYTNGFFRSQYELVSLQTH